jgi:Tol biopolymer transport system component
MKIIFFLTILVPLLFMESCKKDQQAELEENPTCNNTTLTINDTLIALITFQSSSTVGIHKIQNGVSDTIASQIGFEFWGPSISPDRSKFICFRSTTANSIDVDDYSTAEMWLFNIDGSNGHAITTLTAQALTGMGMAKWAPDGFHIVFSGEKLETDGNLHWNAYLTDTLGTLGIKMNSRLGSFKYPAFPNGDMTRIVYQAWVVGVVNAGGANDTELHLADLNGAFQFTAEEKLTNNNQYETSPSYSMDNSAIVYAQTTSLAANTAIELHTLLMSSGATNTLLSNNTICQNPVWCNTNNKIYFSNKAGSACFGHGMRLEANGMNLETPYKKMNQHFLQIDVK